MVGVENVIHENELRSREAAKPRGRDLPKLYKPLATQRIVRLDLHGDVLLPGHAICSQKESS